VKRNVLELKKNLSDHELSVFNSEIEKYKKNIGLSYLLWLFLGTLGIHKFYIGKPILGLIYLLLGIGAWLSLFLGLATGAAGGSAESVSAGMATGVILFIVLIIILGIMLLIDLFTIPRQIRKTYEKKEYELLEKLQKSEA